jgi:hypothetical protein
VWSEPLPHRARRVDVRKHRETASADALEAGAERDRMLQLGAEPRGGATPFSEPSSLVVCERRSAPAEGGQPLRSSATYGLLGCSGQGGLTLACSCGLGLSSGGLVTVGETFEVVGGRTLPFVLGLV